MHLRLLYAFLPLFLASSCAINRSSTLVFPKDTKGCFLLYDLKRDALLVEQGETCRIRFPACSTFKVPLAVMAFDANLLRDENQVVSWDGRKRMLPSWNRDHNAQSWMQNSVVWFSQVLTPQLGKERIEAYLRSFHYGNASVSSGLTDAWLHPPNNPTGNLELSAYEQLAFLKRLWGDQLSVSKRSMRIARELMYLETSPRGLRLSGKTGSNFFDEARSYQFGWFVAHIGNDSEEFIVVTNLMDLKPISQEGVFGGPRAKELTRGFLKQRNLW